MATLEQIEKIHSPAYIKRILKTAEQRITTLAPDTPISADSYFAAWLAAGTCIKGVESLMTGACDAFFGFVRPPGHHALPDKASGFCIFNNIAIAAQYAQDRFSLERILVIDWDIHHGNGIHDIFYYSDRVFYLSTHDPMMYPYTGDIHQTGSGSGTGYTVNIPIVREFSDDDMLYLYQEILTPLITRYQPQLIMVAAGFDAHAGDPIGRSRLTHAFYGGITRLLMHLRKLSLHAPLFYALEGGYDQRALSDSIRAILTELLGDLAPMPPLAPGQAAKDLVAGIKSIHSPYNLLC
jgi:acetoin utilization deacetylase AcuC-like enzyme